MPHMRRNRPSAEEPWAQEDSACSDRGAWSQKLCSHPAEQRCEFRRQRITRREGAHDRDGARRRIAGQRAAGCRRTTRSFRRHAVRWRLAGWRFTGCGSRRCVARQRSAGSRVGRRRGRWSSARQRPPRYLAAGRRAASLLGLPLARPVGWRRRRAGPSKCGNQPCHKHWRHRRISIWTWQREPSTGATLQCPLQRRKELRECGRRPNTFVIAHRVSASSVLGGWPCLSRTRLAGRTRLSGSPRRSDGRGAHLFEGGHRGRSGSLRS